MAQYKLNQVELHKFLLNAQIFIIPLVTQYCGMVGYNLQVDGNVIDITDFIPNSFVLGGMAYYLQATLMDYYRKLRG